MVERVQVPPVSVKKTVWHPDARRRFAVITFEEDGELLELSEGDAIGPLVVKAIKPSGVLFYHNGVEIRYNVGE
jgi:type II secretory pathway component PulC